ncbi:MAG: hypothetical protein HY675_24890 [Chloroflexi bacterium]|nr:hypothetical protein [Chloroflexota bacterium]
MLFGVRFLWLIGLLSFLALIPVGCGPSGLLYEVRPLAISISPNGDGFEDFARVSYSIGARADVTIRLRSTDGQVYTLRDAVTRAQDTYEIKFDGTVDADGLGARRVLPDGQYTMSIRVADLEGRSAEHQVSVAIHDADTVPLEVSDVVVQPMTISPNRDGDDDEAIFSYALSKKSTAEIFVTDKDARFHLLSPQKEREAGLHSFRWDGTENGGKLLPDGQYTYHIRAWDRSGNVTRQEGRAALANGGTPRLEIVEAKFTPASIPLGGVVKVRIKVKNAGETTIKSDTERWGVGPAPGAAYTTDINYAHWRDKDGTPLYYERPGTWRVGVSWTNAPTPPPFPVRWSLGKDLAPGEEVEITGEIRVLQKTRDTYFWATVVQEGVGFVGDNKGQTLVIVSY